MRGGATGFYYNFKAIQHVFYVEPLKRFVRLTVSIRSFIGTIVFLTGQTSFFEHFLNKLITLDYRKTLHSKFHILTFKVMFILRVITNRPHRTILQCRLSVFPLECQQPCFLSTVRNSFLFNSILLSTPCLPTQCCRPVFRFRIHALPCSPLGYSFGPSLRWSDTTSPLRDRPRVWAYATVHRNLASKLSPTPVCRLRCHPPPCCLDRAVRPRDASILPAPPSGLPLLSQSSTRPPFHPSTNPPFRPRPNFFSTSVFVLLSPRRPPTGPLV